VILFLGAKLRLYKRKEPGFESLARGPQRLSNPNESRQENIGTRFRNVKGAFKVEVL
jgi:hypothetical protein